MTDRKDYYKEYAQSRRDSGRCVRCGLAHETGRTECPECLKLRSDYRKQQRADMSMRGLCTKCRKTPTDGTKLCGACNKSQAAISSAHRKGRAAVGFCSNCGAYKASPGKKTCEMCLSRVKKQNEAQKLEIIEAYGGQCACCGEANPGFLTIDHVNNDGKTHRDEVGSGHGVYRWLKKNGFPQEGFQLLCFNCNSGRHINGGTCPHKETPALAGVSMGLLF